MSTDRIFKNVIAAMQEAEELGGPDVVDYLELMSRIACEANQRIYNALELLRDEDNQEPNREGQDQGIYGDH